MAFKWAYLHYLIVLVLEIVMVFCIFYGNEDEDEYAMLYLFAAIDTSKGSTSAQILYGIPGRRDDGIITAFTAWFCCYYW